MMMNGKLPAGWRRTGETTCEHLATGVTVSRGPGCQLDGEVWHVRTDRGRLAVETRRLSAALGGGRTRAVLRDQAAWRA